jgi:hypothetical protein
MRQGPGSPIWALAEKRTSVRRPEINRRILHSRLLMGHIFSSD